MNNLSRQTIQSVARVRRVSRRMFADDRQQGYEALSELEPKKKVANYAVAGACVAFITGVWYYSIRAVGRGDGELEELEKAAQNKITVHQSGFKAPIGASMQTPIKDGMDYALAAPENEEKKSIQAGISSEDNGIKPPQMGWR